MADNDKPRLVSGEIMAIKEKAPISRPDDGDVVEAEYETITALGRQDRSARSPVGVLPPVPAPGGMDMLRGVSGQVGAAARGGPVFWSVGLCLVGAAFWVSGGHVLFERTTPRMAPVAQPLAIEKVASRVEPRGGRQVLFVEGEAHNRGAGALPVPPIAIAITDGEGTTSRHFLGTNGALLAPGERIGFSSRVEAPSNGVKTVTVTFRRD